METQNLNPDASRQRWKDSDGFPGLGRKLRILVAPANKGGCSYYRAWSPYEMLAKLYPNVMEVRFNDNPLGIDVEKGTEDTEYKDIKWCDVFMTQNLANFGGPATARYFGIAKQFGKFVHYDTDDLLIDIYDDHRLKGVYIENDLENLTKHLYHNADLVTVTQSKFAHRVAPYCTGTLAVIKNAIDYSLPAWNKPKVIPRNKRCVRVGWVGGIHHEADLKEFTGVPHLVNQRIGVPNVFWGFYGRPPKDPERPQEDWQQDVWDNYEKELLRGFKRDRNWSVFQALPTDRYGEFYTNIDLSIAPLQNNAFNDSKSDIKVAECGRYKIPLVASNIGCYSDTVINGYTGHLLAPDAPKSDWVKVLNKLLRDRKAVKEMGENLHALTEKLFSLENVVHTRLDVLEYSMQGHIQNLIKEEAKVE